MDDVVEYARPADTEPPTPDLPTVGGFVQLPQSWDSSAGKIQNLVEHACGGVGVLTSRRGSVRANHWHKNDFHYLYVLSGLVEYEEWEHDKLHPNIALGNYQARLFRRGPDEPIPPTPAFANLKKLVVGPGQMIFTPPRRSHRLTFLEDTVMISVSKLSRRHAEHERDVVRL